MVGELPHMVEDALHKLTGSTRILKGNVIRNGIEFAESGLGPDYFSHRDMRRLASAWDKVRPSSMAFSPRAIPSSKPMRRCNDS